MGVPQSRSYTSPLLSVNRTPAPQGTCLPYVRTARATTRFTGFLAGEHDLYDRPPKGIGESIDDAVYCELTHVVRMFGPGSCSPWSRLTVSLPVLVRLAR